VLCTCKTMLDLPGTRQMIIKPSLYQGDKQGKLCPKFAAVYQIYISKVNKQMAAKYVAKSQVKDIRN
jgi:hypothetical protein